MSIDEDQFAADCLRFYGFVLTGIVAHYCDEFDGLPNDETCDEQFWACCGCMWTDTESCRDFARRRGAVDPCDAAHGRDGGTP